MSKRILQVILAVIGSISIITGLWGIISGIRGDYYAIPNVPANIILDSNLRYHSGLWLTVGLIIFWIIPSIEKQKIILRLICGMIFTGGIGRVISMIVVGIPSPLFIIFTLLEIIFPLLIFWQHKIAQSYNK